MNLGQAAESHFLRVRIPEFYRFQREKAATELSLSRLFCRRVVCAGAAGPFSNNPLSPNRRRPPATDASRTGTPGRRHESSNPGFQLPDDASSNHSGGVQSTKKDLAPACSRRPPPRARLARRLSFRPPPRAPLARRLSFRPPPRPCPAGAAPLVRAGEGDPAHREVERARRRLQPSSSMKTT